MKFKVTYKDGSEVIREQSDCNSVEQMVNCMFGTGHNLEELGITVESMDVESPLRDSASLEPKVVASKVDDKVHVVKVAKAK